MSFSMSVCQRVLRIVWWRNKWDFPQHKATTILHTWGVEWHTKYQIYEKNRTRINKPDNFPFTERNKRKKSTNEDGTFWISFPFKVAFSTKYIYFSLCHGFLFYIFRWLIFILFIPSLFFLWFCACVDGVKLYDGGKLLYSLFMLNAIWVRKSSVLCVPVVVETNEYRNINISQQREVRQLTLFICFRLKLVCWLSFF